MDPDDAKALAREFDFAGEIIPIEREMAAGVGPGCGVIVKAPGEPPRVGREAVEYLRPLIPHLSAKQEQAMHAVRVVGGGPPKEVMDGERIALSRLEREDD